MYDEVKRPPTDLEKKFFAALSDPKGHVFNDAIGTPKGYCFFCGETEDKHAKPSKLRDVDSY